MRVESSFLAGTLRDVESEKFRASYAATLAALQDTLGNGALRRGLADVAFGSLLHVVQDGIKLNEPAFWDCGFRIPPSEMAANRFCVPRQRKLRDSIETSLRLIHRHNLS